MKKLGQSGQDGLIIIFGEFVDMKRLPVINLSGQPADMGLFIK